MLLFAACLLLLDHDQCVYAIKNNSIASIASIYNDCTTVHVVDDVSFIHEYVNLNIW